MKPGRKGNKFIRLPRLAGGKARFLQFIRNNLVYPPEAIANNIQGVVYLSCEIDSNGNPFNIKIDKGLGYGCDDEAVRLIKTLLYEKVRNRGVSVSIKQKFRIEFKLPKAENITLNYSVTNADRKTNRMFGYSININRTNK